MECSTRRHQMAGVRLHDQPDFSARLELEGIPRRQGEVDFHFHAAIHPHHHDDVTLFYESTRPEMMFRALRPAGCTVASRISPARIPTISVEPGSARTSGVSSSTLLLGDAAGHGAAIFVGCSHDGVKNILEADELSQGFAAGRSHDCVRGSVGNDAAILEDQYAVAQRKYLVAAVSHIENRDGVGCVPCPQIIDDFRFSGSIECGQGFVEQQDARVGDQGAS